MSQQVWWWWHLLGAISLLNLAAWGYASWRQRRLCVQALTDNGGTTRWQLWLSLAYVVGCGYRSCFPVFDVPRLCLVDGAWSSVMVGRSVATIAELCFALQWALLARALARRLDSPVLTAVAATLPALIGLAELSSWYAVLTQANIGHVLEESLWALGAGLFSVAVLAHGARLPASVRPPCLGLAIAGLAYTAYLVAFDVPMYWHRWAAQQAAGRVLLDLPQGWQDVAHHWRVSWRWEDWRSEVVWMTLYFSVGVWCSVGLIHLHPRLAPATAPA